MSGLLIGTVEGKPFTLPVDVVTQTMAILAKRRAGKSYTMRRLVEQLVKAGQQVVLVDPKGDQWGVRSSADGKRPGLPLVILGGERGDAPLEPASGELIAKLVVEERVSAVIDLSLFRKNEVARFMTGFMETLYRMKAREAYRTPMMLIMDEADAIAPQRPMKGEERMLGAAEDIVRRGGQRGIGCCLVSQRSAVLNKNVLTQAQILVALRTIAPQDLDAMKAWIDVHGTEEQRRTLMESLPSLPVGDAWFWSPGWPTVDGIFRRVDVAEIETYDSGATPKPGEKRREPKTLADIDLEALKRQMSETIEKAKAEDPKELQKRIRELERELRQAQKGTPAAATSVDVDRMKQVLSEVRARERSLERQVEDLRKLLKTERAATDRWYRGVYGLTDKLRGQMDAFPAPADDATPEAPTISAARLSESGENIPNNIPRIIPAPAPAEPAEGVTRPQQRILDVLAELEGIGLEQPDRSTVAVFADQSPRSSGYANNLGRLRTLGLIDYPAGGQLVLTDAGRAIANGGAGAATLPELHEAWLLRVSAPQQRILQALIEAYPEPIDRSDLAVITEQSPNSSGYANNLGFLRNSLGLIDYPAGRQVVATKLLFPDGLR